MKLPKELKEKGDLKSQASKGKKCSVIGCGKPAIRSLSENKIGNYVKRAGFKFTENRLHKVYLCKEHYKEANKLRKSEEKVYQKKGFLDDAHGMKKGKNFD